MIRPATAEAVRHVAEWMRKRDLEETRAITFGEPDPAGLIARVETGQSWAVVAHAADGEPVALVGADPDRPGVWTVYAFGTPRWGEVVGGLTRYVRRVMIPSLVSGGAHRAQCYSISTYTQAHRWIELLGAKQEAVLRQFGRHGEDFIVFRWLATELKNVRKPQAGPGDRQGAAGAG